jgi:hypothetical protein
MTHAINSRQPPRGRQVRGVEGNELSTFLARQLTLSLPHLGPCRPIYRGQTPGERPPCARWMAGFQPPSQVPLPPLTLDRPAPYAPLKRGASLELPAARPFVFDSARRAGCRSPGCPSVPVSSPMTGAPPAPDWLVAQEARRRFVHAGDTAAFRRASAGVGSTGGADCAGRLERSRRFEMDRRARRS